MTYLISWCELATNWLDLSWKICFNIKTWKTFLSDYYFIKQTYFSFRIQILSESWNLPQICWMTANISLVVCFHKLFDKVWNIQNSAKYNKYKDKLKIIRSFNCLTYISRFREVHLIVYDRAPSVTIRVSNKSNILYYILRLSIISGRTLNQTDILYPSDLALYQDDLTLNQTYIYYILPI